MSKSKNKLTDIIYTQMLYKNPISVISLSQKLALWMQETDGDVANQLLSLAATLICLFQKYDLNHIDVLSIAENIVFSDEYNNMQLGFKKIMNTFKNKEEI